VAEKNKRKDRTGNDGATKDRRGPKGHGGKWEEAMEVPEKDEQSPWPQGIRLSEGKDQTCSIPGDLAIVLSQEAFTQLFGYAYATPLEISCLGVVKKDGPVFRIERFHLVRQTSSTGHTELDNEAVTALIEGLIGEGARDEVTRLKCWAHSHPGFKCFWSKTDDETCARLVTDWLVSLVVSHEFAVRARIDVGGAVPFAIDQVPVFAETAIDKALLANLRAEARQLVVEGLPLLRRLGAATKEAKPPVAEEYCDLCGSWHPGDQCPFDDWPSAGWDDDEEDCQPGRRGEPSLPGFDETPE